MGNLSLSLQASSESHRINILQKRPTKRALTFSMGVFQPETRNAPSFYFKAASCQIKVTLNTPPLYHECCFFFFFLNHYHYHYH